MDARAAIVLDHERSSVTYDLGGVKMLSAYYGLNRIGLSDRIRM